MENEVTGMASAVSALGSSLSAAEIWGVFTQAIPFIAISVLVAVGARILWKTLGKTKKMK